MLTGLLCPDKGIMRLFFIYLISFALSAGDAYFYGHSVTKELDLVRSSLGVCPQVMTVYA